MDLKNNLSRGCYFLDDKYTELRASFAEGCNKLNTYDWLRDIPRSPMSIDIVEIRFKNTRKEYFKNVNYLRLKPGDIAAVEASPGHDIGIVSLLGDLVIEQLNKNSIDKETFEFKKIYRKAKTVDIDKWREAMQLEHTTMLRSREIAESFNLDMKIGDVEYQGDKTKAIFYYIADERVDFRELIKVLAEEFKVRIEMRQIGARQEAGRIGGIGSCGRRLCCTTWISNFSSVTTNSARCQELSLNPQKLAGQCSKLKCCLNYELDCYLDAQNDFPDKAIALETKKGRAYHQKTDVFRRTMWYSLENEDAPSSLIPLSVERVKEVLEINQAGRKVDNLISDVSNSRSFDVEYTNVGVEDSITRFEDKKKSTKKRNKRRKSNKSSKRSKKK